MMNITDLIGRSPIDARTVEDVQSAGVSVRKDKRDELSASDRLKLSKAAREGGGDKFSFFVTDGTASNDFKSIYDLQMQVDALITSLTLYDMVDVFQVLTVDKVHELELCTVALNTANANLAEADIDDATEVSAATSLVLEAEDKLAKIQLNPKNLLTDYKDVSVEDVRATNSYYSRWGADYVVENLQWSEDRCLGTCEVALKSKVREGLTGVPSMEKGGPLAFKMMLEVVMDVEDSSLRSMTDRIKTVRMKDIPGENIGTIASYLKGVILLLDNCNSLPTDVLGLLNDVMTSAESKVFCEYMQSIYFAHKRKIKEITPREYVEFAEKEYRSLYRDNKWNAVKIDPESSFYTGDREPRGGRGNGGRGGRGNGGRGHNRWEKCECHNCGKLGHIKRNCWLPGGGASKESGEDADGSSEGNTLPGANSDAISRPPRGGEPRFKRLQNGDEVVWCGSCSKWGNHLTSGHVRGSNTGDAGEGASAGVDDGDDTREADVGSLAEMTNDDESVEVEGGSFARLRLAGLI